MVGLLYFEERRRRTR